MLTDLVDLLSVSSSSFHHGPIHRLAPVPRLHFVSLCSAVYSGRTMPHPTVIFNSLQGSRVVKLMPQGLESFQAKSPLTFIQVGITLESSERQH